ncbi:MAG: nuclear transport factor 2 family protein [Myxococcota bacterium]
MAPMEDGPLLARVVEMERAVGQASWDEARAFFTDDANYQVAGRGQYRGVDGIRRYMEWQGRLVTWTGHTPQMMLEHGNAAIIEVISHFRRLADDAELAIPCTDIYRFEGERICDWRVYADTASFLGGPVMAEI